MLAYRRLIVPFALGVLLLIAAPAAAAAPAVTTTKTTVREPVNWTLPADQCPSLPAGLSLSGSGHRLAQNITTARADGSSTLLINDLVKGTAVDSNNHTYRFLYQNHSTQVFPPSGSGLPVRVHMTDIFVLSSSDGGTSLNVGFNWRWTYTPPDTLFSSLDNLEKLSTRGDPFSCDPI